jgi:GH15 family glucan-1,4-alpha-glucosidase
MTPAKPKHWEMRGDPQHHLSSKVLCWTALDRAVKLGAMLGERAAQVDEWAAERDRIRDAVLTRGPQAFSHIGLITAAWEIDKARRVDSAGSLHAS